MKKNPKEKQSVGIYVRLTPNEAKALRAHAKKYKCSMAQSLRSLAAEKIFFINLEGLPSGQTVSPKGTDK